MKHMRTAILAVLVLAPAMASANSLAATPEAALAGSGFGLRISLDDPEQAPRTDVWVAIGPDKGLRDETAIRGCFLIDPGGLTIGGASQLPFLRLLQNPGSDGERIVFLLEAGPDDTRRLAVWIRDDPSGRLVLAGKGALAGSGPEPGSSTSRPHARQVEFEWGAASSPEASDGYLRVYRRGTGPKAGRVLLFERTDLSNGSQTLNHLRVGVYASQHPAGTHGDLDLDEFALYRTPEGTPED